MQIFKRIISYFWATEKPDLKELSEFDYREKFEDSKIKDAYEKAWSSKNFEIENYWKRANYFWAFQVASFAGYFAVFNSNFYSKNTEVLYCVVCIGLITAIAWTLINKGSKSWQRNWENHVDMLEDKVTGPLYKIVSVDKTYSVSNINEIVSMFISVIWIILGIKYFTDNISFKNQPDSPVNVTVVLSTIAVVCFLGAMFFGHGRGLFGKRNVKFYSRKNP